MKVIGSHVGRRWRVTGRERPEKAERIVRVTRDFTVAVFIIHQNRVLLFYHKKHQMWLPPGGHIEADELPDEAAVREVKEETGLEITLLGKSGLPIQEPRQLLTPEGIQVERIGNAAEEHEHIDLIYYAVPATDWEDVTGLSSEGVTKQLLFSADEVEEGGWFEREELFRMDLAEDVKLWSIKALQEVPARVAALRQKGTSNK